MARATGELRFGRDELIQRLEARRAWAQRIDAAALTEHRKAEADYLKRFRAACRDALKWDYEQVKQERSVRVEGKSGSYVYPPSCPSRAEATLDRELAVIRAMRDSARVVIKEGGTWSQVWWLLTHDETITDEAC